MRRAIGIALAVVVMGVAATTANAAEIPFRKVFATDVNGDIAIAANGNAQCDVSVVACTEALFRRGSKLNNNDWVMQYVNLDGLAETYSSSAALLALPDGATVLHAHLYWGGYTSAKSRETVSLRHGTLPYETVRDTSPGTFGDSGRAYGGAADVTDYVRSHGGGTYWVANIDTQVGSTDVHAGWALVVAYANPADPPRNLAIFDGYLAVESGKASVTAQVDGFLTPRIGPVRTAVGAVAWEGDVNLKGDQLLLNGRQLSNNANPADNAFNSTVSTFGEYVNSRTPAYTNLMGVDADLFGADATYLPNGSTSATVEVKTNSDRILLSALTFATELYAPNLETRKTVEDLNGGEVEAGDRLRYTITTTNSGADAALRVTLDDPLPPHTRYVAGSATAGNGVADREDDAIRAYVGSGFARGAGGTLAPGESATMTFDVEILAGTPGGTEIPNTVTASGLAATLAKTLRTSSNTRTVTVGKGGSETEGGPDGDPSPSPVINEGSSASGATATRTSIGVTIGPSKQHPRAGSRFAYRVRTINTADGIAADDVVTCVPIPRKVTVVRTYGGVVRDGRVCWSAGTLASGETRSYRLDVRVAAGTEGSVVLARATATSSNAGPARSRARVDVPDDPAPAPAPSPVTG